VWYNNPLEEILSAAMFQQKKIETTHVNEGMMNTDWDGSSILPASTIIRGVK